MAARVTRISIAPVKSLGLLHPNEIELEPHGVRGNRRFWLVDRNGRLFNNYTRCLRPQAVSQRLR